MKPAESLSLKLILFVLTAASLAVRVHFARPDIYPSVDGVFYLEQCRSLVLHHRLPFSSFSPGWPILTSVPLVFRDPTESMQVFRAAQGANVLIGVLCQC